MTTKRQIIELLRTLAKTGFVVEQVSGKAEAFDKQSNGLCSLIHLLEMEQEVETLEELNRAIEQSN